MIPNYRDNSISVIVLCVFYSLIQTPTHAPKLTNGLAYNTSLVDVTEYRSLLGSFFITEAVLFYISAIGICCIFPLIQGLFKSYIWLAIGVILSITRFITPDITGSHNYIYAVIGDGLGYSILYLSLTKVLRQKTYYEKITRSFSLFSAVYGSTYIIFASVVIINKEPPYGPLFRYFSILCYGIGSLIGLLYMAYQALCSNEDFVEAEQSSLIIDNKLELQHHVSLRVKLSLVLPVLFYGFITSFLANLYCHCVALSTSFFADSLISFGVGYMLVCIQWSYTYKKWYKTSRTLVAMTTMVIAIFLLRKTDRNACYFGDEVYWYLWPLTSILLGLSLGSVTCEVYTLINVVWRSRYRFSLLFISQCAWNIALIYCPFILDVRFYMPVFGVLSVLYVSTVALIQVKVKQFVTRMSQLKLEIRRSNIRYGSNYSRV